MPSASRLSSQLDQIDKVLAALSIQASEDEAARKRLLRTLRRATTLLESPVEVIWRMIMEPHQSASLRSAMAMGLLEPIVSAEGPKTATELQTITGCDKQLIVRVMRPLTAMGIFAEVAYETYTSSPISQILASPPVGGGFKFMFDQGAVSAIHMPRFLTETGFKNPEGPLGCFQSAFKTDMQLFPWLMENPEQMGYFNDLMEGQRLTRIEWFDVAPADKILIDTNGDPDSPLVVDIGGNRGNDLEALRNKYPSMIGKLILQDLQPVISDIKILHQDIVRMSHDFFTPQPIIGSKAYYLRYILHDYSDSKCREILSHIVKAMKQGYSKMLIFEYILPDVGTPLFPALLDIQMLAVLSGTERTESMWRTLLDEVGLEIVKFWRASEETEGLIEAIKKR